MPIAKYKYLVGAREILIYVVKFTIKVLQYKFLFSKSQLGSNYLTSAEIELSS